VWHDKDLSLLNTALSAEHRPIFYSLSTAMVTSLHMNEKFSYFVLRSLYSWQVLDSPFYKPWSPMSSLVTKLYKTKIVTTTEFRTDGEIVYNNNYPS
jgi:hypothetical protein